MTAEASELGWPPGEWPRVVLYDDSITLNLIRVNRGTDRSVLSVVYGNGALTLEVFND